MTPQAATHFDKQAIAAQYVRYAYDCNTRNYTALGHLLTPGCRVDVRGTDQSFLSYVRQKLQHTEILKLKVLKIVIRRNTATVLMLENNWRTGGPPAYSPITRQDFLVRSAAGWRIAHSHTTGVTVTIML